MRHQPWSPASRLVSAVHADLDGRAFGGRLRSCASLCSGLFRCASFTVRFTDRLADLRITVACATVPAPYRRLCRCCAVCRMYAQVGLIADAVADYGLFGLFLVEEVQRRSRGTDARLVLASGGSLLRVLDMSISRHRSRARSPGALEYWKLLPLLADPSAHGRVSSDAISVRALLARLPVLRRRAG
jgi:hypothetical protein